MAKIKVKRIKTNAVEVRQRLLFYYNEKFFNKWMNKLKLDGLNYQQEEYIMRKWWATGVVACSKPVGVPNNLGIDFKEDSIIFTPFAPQNVFNIYDWPTEAMPINTRGVKFVSDRPLSVDKEIVIGYIQKNHKSIYSSIEAKINEIVDIEMTIRICIFTQKMPWLIGTTPENKQEVEDLIEGLQSDEPFLFTTLEEPEKAKSLISGAPYILDKLQNMVQVLVNEILTFLGCNNIGIPEKKEHLLNEEVNANNQDIQENSDQFLEMAKYFFDRVDKVFGKKVTPKAPHEAQEASYEYQEVEEVEDE